MYLPFLSSKGRSDYTIYLIPPKIGANKGYRNRTKYILLREIYFYIEIVLSLEGLIVIAS